MGPRQISCAFGRCSRTSSGLKAPAFDLRDAAGLFLFGVAAAAISREWLSKVLHTMRIHIHVLRLAQALYMGAAVHIAWGGTECVAIAGAVSNVAVRCQGPCGREPPTYALSFPRSPRRSWACGSQSLRGFVVVGRDMAAATNLWPNARKSQLVDSSMGSPDTVC